MKNDRIARANQYMQELQVIWAEIAEAKENFIALPTQKNMEAIAELFHRERTVMMKKLFPALGYKTARQRAANDLRNT